jgi:ADP-ribosylglycohydrolase
MSDVLLPDAVAAAIHDRLLGVLFGAAVGDALGISTEFLSSAEADAFVTANIAAHGGSLSYKDWPGRLPDGTILPDASSRRLHHNQWTEADWSDDTDQHILIVQTFLDEGAATDGALRVSAFANRFVAWLDHGFPAFGDTHGVGSGNSTKMSGSNPLIRAGNDARLVGFHSWAHPFFSACRKGSGALLCV